MLKTMMNPKRVFNKIERSKKSTYRSRKNRLIVVGKIDFKGSEKPTSRGRKIRLIVVEKSELQRSEKSTQLILNPYKVGKQSYKELKSQGSGLSNIEITDGNIKSFERVAKKYRLDFALKKDSSTKPPTYYVFFKGQDTEMMNLAFKKYLGVQMNKKEKPSIMKKLMHFKDAVSKGKNRERAREQQKDRGQSL